ncbi:MAG: hypothetical protein U1G07_26430 [Verrucomicrobiota bacterium]
MRIEPIPSEGTPPPRKAQNRIPFVVHHLAARKKNRLASIRIPVTPANRELLRELRAAELRAWANSFGPSARRCEVKWEEEL